MKSKTTGIILTLLISACTANTADQDLHRQELVDACINSPSYKNRKPETASRHCACVYDKTMKGLTDAERLVARFYLSGQVGLNVKDREEFKSMDVGAMGKAAQRIGVAVQACPKP